MSADLTEYNYSIESSIGGRFRVLRVLHSFQGVEYYECVDEAEILPDVVTVRVFPQEYSLDTKKMSRLSEEFGTYISFEDNAFFKPLELIHFADQTLLVEEGPRGRSLQDYFSEKESVCLETVYQGMLLLLKYAESGFVDLDKLPSEDVYIEPDLSFSLRYSYSTYTEEVEPLEDTPYFISGNKDKSALRLSVWFYQLVTGEALISFEQFQVLKNKISAEGTERETKILSIFELGLYGDSDSEVSLTQLFNNLSVIDNPSETDIKANECSDEELSDKEVLDEEVVDIEDSPTDEAIPIEDVKNHAHPIRLLIMLLALLLVALVVCGSVVVLKIN